MYKVFKLEKEINLWVHKNKLFYEKKEENYMKAYSRIEGFNERLRAGRMLLDDWKYLDMELSKMINRYKMPERIVVFRGITNSAYKQMIKDAETIRGNNSFPAKYLIERAYMSTSLIKGRELKSEILLKIFVPKGINFLYIGENSVSPDQTEMLFGKNTVMQEIGQNGNCIEVEIIQQL